MEKYCFLFLAHDLYYVTHGWFVTTFSLLVVGLHAQDCMFSNEIAFFYMM